MNILMPQLGETVAEGKITKWFKSAGDTVKPGDNLFEIETDKVSMEVPATEAGVLSEIRVSEGEVAPVGAVVAVIGARGRSRGYAAGQSRSTEPTTPAAAPVAAAPAPARSFATARPKHPSSRSSSIRSSRCARPARNYGPAQAVRRHRRDAAGAAARRRSRHRSLAIARLRPARPHCRARCRKRAAPDGARPHRLGGRAHRRSGQGAVRSGGLRGSAARRDAPDHRGAAPAGQTNNPAFLSDHRHHTRPAVGGA